MTMLPPPPPKSGKHPIYAHVPPPMDHRHPSHTHEVIEKPSVRPFLLDIQEDEFRSGHLLPKFPPAEALPKPPPRAHGLEGHKPRFWTPHLIHTLELGAIVAVFALVAIDGRTVTPSSAAQPTVIGQTLDAFPNIFPIEPLKPVEKVAPVKVEQPKPVVPPPVFKTAPLKTAPIAPLKTAPVAPTTEEPKTEAPAPEPARPAEPPPKEDPNGGVQDPGF